MPDPENKLSFLAKVQMVSWPSLLVLFLAIELVSLSDEMQTVASLLTVFIWIGITHVLLAVHLGHRD